MTHIAAAGVDDPRMATLLEEHWEAMMRRWPTWATKVGDHRYDHLLADTTPDAWARTRAGIEEWLGKVEAIDPTTLSSRDATTWSVLRNEFATAKATSSCLAEQWQVAPMGNAFSAIHHLPDVHPIRTPTDGENLVKRYRGVDAYVDGVMDNLRLGLKSARVPNAENVRRTIHIIDEELARPQAEWALLEPARPAPTEWSEVERDTLSHALAAAVKETVRPAIVRYRDFLHDELLPASRGPDKAGIGWLPNGQECYAATIEEHTNLELTADQIHTTGIEELKGIHKEFQVLGQRLWGTDDLQEIFHRLRTDKTLFFQSPKAVQKKADEALARARAAMPKWFGKLPQAACVVVPIPEHEARYSTIAYYRPPNPDGSKPGQYFINTTKPETRPRHEAEVLAYHESIPGHHLQIAIAQEQGSLPMIRRHIRPNSYIEGWALYTERLADEMGLYSSDLDRLGMLSFDAWRASRLVVDTGLHAKGWTRAQAIEFMAKNTPLARNNIDNEVDRYISWPGQALSYKLGQLEIRGLRSEAEKALGERFSLPAFHDAVLENGAVPLPVLRTRIEAWVQAQTP